MKYLKKFNEQNELPEGMQIGGLKCDNPNCNYSDMSVPFSDYESSIGKPCPDCGESLLTQEDYDQVIQIINAFDAVSSFSEEELQQLANNMSQEEIDAALDMMNKLKVKKKGQDDQGNDIWSIG